MELLSTERVTFPNDSYVSYQEIRRTKRENTVCAIFIGLSVAKVERVTRRVIAMMILFGRRVLLKFCHVRAGKDLCR
jgi:hypothetical protein